jgi:GTP cyclohydrolase II
VQDQCMTSEIFGSRKCDCRQQLDLSLEQLQQAAADAFDVLATAASPLSAEAQLCSLGSAHDADRIVGVVVYMPQEGRGVGLGQKVAAYALQEDASGADGSLSPGLDTVDANRALGLPDDAREYSAVPFVLADLGLLEPAAQGASSAAEASTVRWNQPATCDPLVLLTNNPRKMEHLCSLGVPLSGRASCHAPPFSVESAKYLEAKARRMGHDIPDKYLEYRATASAYGESSVS